MHAQTDTPVQLAECASQLDALVRRASAFVAQQLGQLDDIGLQMAAEARQSHSTEGAAGMDEVEWLQQKAADERRIEEQLDHLAKAWKELEGEQRRLMLLEQTASQPTFEPAGAMVSEPETAAAQAPVVAPRARDLIDETAPLDAASAALQFQKLKREIRQQTRRQR